MTIAGVTGRPASAAILVGGDSRRMGRDKASLAIDGRTLVARAHGHLAAIVDEILLVVRPERRAWAEALAPAGVRVVIDRVAARGPLAGIHAALSAAVHARVLVVACDMPDLQPSLLSALLADPGADVVVPRTERGYEPLLAVYARTCLPAIENALAAGSTRVSAFFSDVDVSVWDEARLQTRDPDLRSLINVNTLGDLEVYDRRRRVL